MIKSPIFRVSSIMVFALLFGCKQSANGASEMYHQAQVLKESNHILLVGEDNAGANITLENEQSKLVKNLAIPELKNANAIYCFDSSCWIGGGRGLSGSIIEVDLNLSSKNNQMKVDVGEIYSLSYIPSKELIVLGHATGKLSFVPRNEVSNTQTVNISSAEIFSVAYSDNLGKVVCGDERGKLYFISPDSNYDIVNTISGEGAVYSISVFDPKNLLIGRSTGEIQLLNVETLELKTLFAAEKNAAMVCDSDQKLGTVTCGMSDGSVYGIKLSDGDSIKLASHDSKVIGIRYAEKDGNGISVDAGGKVKKWKF